MSAESLKILNNFFPYAEKIGLELLQEDRKYLRCLSIGLPPELLREALKRYIGHWQSEMRSEPNETKKQGVGRRLANQKIREFFDYEANSKFAGLDRAKKKS